MKGFHRITVLSGLALSLFVVGCTSQNKSTADTRAADQEAVRQADMAWSATAEGMQMEAFYGYFLDDAAVMASNEPAAKGKEAIRAMMDTYFALPGFSVKWAVSDVVVANSGDFAYSVGSYDLTMSAPSGAPMADHGKYVTIWKKQADGNWKVALDMFNSDVPLPSASTSN